MRALRRHRREIRHAERPDRAQVHQQCQRGGQQTVQPEQRAGQHDQQPVDHDGQPEAVVRHRIAAQARQRDQYDQDRADDRRRDRRLAENQRADDAHRRSDLRGDPRPRFVDQVEREFHQQHFKQHRKRHVRARLRDGQQQGQRNQVRVVQQKRDVQSRKKQRDRQPRDAYNPQKRRVLPAHERVVRRMDQVEHRHRRGQRIGGILRQDDELPFHQAGRRAVGPLRLQHLREDRARAVLYELLNDPDSLHARAVDALEPAPGLVHDAVLADALQVHQRDVRRHAGADRQPLRHQLGGLNISPQQRDVRAQALHKPLLRTDDHRLVGRLVDRPVHKAARLQQQALTASVDQHRRHAAEHAGDELPHPVLLHALSDFDIALHQPLRALFRGDRLAGIRLLARMQNELGDLLVVGHALDVNRARLKALAPIASEHDILVQRDVQYRLNIFQILFQLRLQLAAQQLRIRLFRHEIASFVLSILLRRGRHYVQNPRFRSGSG